MARNMRGAKEFTREQRLIKENRQLKRELAHLRKQISRLNLEELESAKQQVFDQEEGMRLNDVIGEPNAELERLKQAWACNECESGWLEIILYSKCGETNYFRKCSNCNKRTKGKRYDKESVKGITKK